MEGRTIQTLGVLRGDGLDRSLNVLERPWRDNRRNDSCVPPAPGGSAIYTLKHRSVPWSKFDYPHLVVENVPSRDHILFHRGNYYSQIKGCKLPGLDFSNVNNDGLVDVTDSKKALRLLLDSVPESGEKYKVQWGSIPDRLEPTDLVQHETRSADDILSNVEIPAE